MIGSETFGDLDLTLKAIMQNSSPFGGVSLLIVGEFYNFHLLSKGSHRSLNGWLWEKFQLHELVEIVRQSSDPDFAQLLKGQQTHNYMILMKALVNTDTSTWPDEFVKVYLNNYLAGQENEGCTGKLNSEVVVIKAQYGNKDIETTTCSIFIPDNIGLSQTANLPAKF